MTISFFAAANGQQTCTVDGRHLHSAYDPEREASRFAEKLACGFAPAYVLITEPGLSYCAPLLRQRFPHARLCCIHYSHAFAQTDGLWDTVFPADAPEGLAESLFSALGEEGLCSCLFAYWPPSQGAFPREHNDAWQGIKSAVLKARDVLATRSYFARRWTKNALRFCQVARREATVEQGNAPIIICASGPSLLSSLPHLRRLRARYFLLAVSSALGPLAHYGLEPDLCLSTDGGYWAKLHISFAAARFPRLPFALPPEAACPAQVLATHPVVPLAYGDGVGEALLAACGYHPFPAVRNGTVSGTAVQLALALTDGPVYCCGLDLSPSSGFAHTQPNALEDFHAQRDFRLRSQETRTASATCASGALSLYRDWFAAADFHGRVMRLSDGYRYRNTLGSIRDVGWDAFPQDAPPAKLPAIRAGCSPASGDRRRTLADTIRANLLTEQWIKSALPAEALLYERSLPEGRDAALAKIRHGMEEFHHDIIRALRAKEDTQCTEP